MPIIPLIVLAMATAWIQSTQAEAGLSKATFDRIKLGMTPKEVVAIVGACSSSGYTTGQSMEETWRDGKKSINIIFNSDYSTRWVLVVTEAEFLDNSTAPPVVVRLLRAK
jgi:hypothetical protein